MEQHRGEGKGRKRKRSVSSNGPVQTMKITDLVNGERRKFCLEKIFAHLDVQSLLNVAVANASLKPMACRVYQRKFGKFLVTIGDRYQNRTDGIKIIRMCGGPTIFVCGVKTCLQYLRCFGPFMRSLRMDSNHSKNDCNEYVHQYVNDYCADSLAHIKFDCMPKFATEQFKKVFIHIKSVDISGCELGDKWLSWLSFVKCFPNLRSLSIYDSKLIYRPVVKPFPFLKHLTLQYIECDLFTTSEIAADLLNGISRLKNFTLFATRPELKINKFLDLIKDCPSITTLKLFANSCDLPINSEEVQRLINEHPALVEFDSCYHLTVDHAVMLTRQLKSLKKFGPDTCTEWENFAVKLKGKWESDGEHWERIDQQK